MTALDRGVRRILLVELEPYDVSAADTTTFYVASEFYATSPTDTPANVQYLGVVSDDVYIDRSMFTGNDIGGVSLPDFGAITINNPKRPSGGARFDDWIDPSVYTWQGRAITVSLLARGDDYANRLQVFKGLIDNLDYTENEIRVSIRSNAYLLDNELQSTRYAGSGGDEGGGDLEGKPKPLCFGRVSNISPIVANPFTLRYQVNGGTISEVVEVRDRGAVLVDNTDYSDDLSNGIIDLVAAADGNLTADIKGSTLGATYSAKPADIMRYIAETLQGVTDINAASIAAVNASSGYEVGYYSGIDNPNALQAMTDLAKTFFGYYGFNRAGQFDVGIFGAPSVSADIELTESDIQLDSMRRQPLNDVFYKVTVNARPNFLVQSRDELAGGVSEDDKALYGKDYQITVSATDATVQTAYPDAREMTVDVLTYDESDAQALADAMLAFYKVPRSIIQMTTNLRPLDVDINDTVKITHPRFNLENGINFRVIRFKEQYLQNKVELSVVG